MTPSIAGANAVNNHATGAANATAGATDGGYADAVATNAVNADSTATATADGFGAFYANVANGGGRQRQLQRLVRRLCRIAG